MVFWKLVVYLGMISCMKEIGKSTYVNFAILFNFLSNQVSIKVSRTY